MSIECRSVQFSRSSCFESRFIGEECNVYNRLMRHIANQSENRIESTTDVQVWLGYVYPTERI